MNYFTAEMDLSLVFRWLRSKIEVTENNIQITEPTTLLHVIPVGKADQNIPMSNVTASQVISHVRGKMLAGGIFLALCSLTSVTQEPLPALLGLAVSVLIIAGAFQSTLFIQRGGNDYAVSVPFTQAGKLRAVHNAIQGALEYTENKKNVTTNTDRIIEALDRK